MTKRARVTPTLSPRELSKFERLLGRQPDEAEQVRLFRLKEALDLHENDEVWTFVLALQHFEWLYEKHPGEIEAAVKQSVSEIQAAARSAASAEVKRARGLLEKAVCDAAAAVADLRAQTSRRLAVCWAAAGLALFGGFALVCGYELGRGGLPFWMRRELALEGSGIERVLGAILGAPAGWTVLIALLPVWAFWLKSAWTRAVDSETALGRRWSAAVSLVAAAATWLGGAAAVAWLIGSLWVGERSHSRKGEKSALELRAPAEQMPLQGTR